MTILGLEVWQIVLIAVTSLGAQVVGGLAGYGTGLLMPLVLVPLIGPQAIVPVISLSALITNPTRVVIFRQHLDWAKAFAIAAFAIPASMVGAWSYTLLTGRGAALVIGTALVLLVPLRRYLARKRFKLAGPAVGVAGLVYGFLTGGTTGVGVILIAMLMAMGLTGLPVIATDALASTLVGLAKTGVFVWAGELPPKLWLVALLIGGMATPGTLIARWLVRRLSAKLHEQLIEGTIVVGGSLLIGRATFGSG
ncbi:MAG: sulfite exporter TauE/SafE family protein [Hyphomicrobiaceae bacterium]|nr:sulfite exporter TauE/SafE family protein [Hyphomicrobiaceae bacterium]